VRSSEATGRTAQAVTTTQWYDFAWVVSSAPAWSGPPNDWAVYAGGTQTWSGANPGANTPLVTHVSTGEYRVDIPGIGGSGGGNVQVVAYGKGAERCKVGSWFPETLSMPGSPLGTSAWVVCHDTTGNLVDSPFLFFFQAGSSYASGLDLLDGQAYVWSNALSASSTPPAEYQWSTSGQPITVQSAGTGQYTVTLPGLTQVGGTFIVTAYGWGSEYCKVGGWWTSSTATTATVYCFTGAGAPANTQFSLTYRYGAPGDAISMEGYFYLWAYAPTSSSYSTLGTYGYNGAGFETVTRSGAGQYVVSAAYSYGFATLWPVALVSGYGSGPDYCKVGVNSASWTSDHLTYSVLCFTPAGVPADAMFDSLFEYVVRRDWACPSCCMAPIPIPPE
jgi:hypothetical protein